MIVSKLKYDELDSGHLAHIIDGMGSSIKPGGSNKLARTGRSCRVNERPICFE